MGGRGGGPSAASAPSATATSGSDTTASPAAVEQAIRDAYLAESPTSPTGWVSLGDIRPHLERLGFTREQQDAGIGEIAVKRDIHLIEIANLKSLTPADRAASLYIGGQNKHAIRINNA